MKNYLVYLGLTLTAVLWGGSFVMTRFLFEAEPRLTPVIIVSIRLLLASLVLIPIVVGMGQWECIQRKDLPLFLIMALLEPFLYFICENSGIRRVPGGLSSVIIATIPLFVPFGLFVAYRERLHWINWVGLLLSILGVWVMIQDKGTLQEVSLSGLLFLIMAVVIAVIYSVFLVKVVNKYKPYTITVYTNLIGLGYFIPLFFCMDFPVFRQLHFTFPMLLALLGLGLCCSALAYILFNLGVKRVGASRASVFNNAIPIFTLIFAGMLGQERITGFKVLGMALILIGVLVAQRGARSGEGSQGDGMREGSPKDGLCEDPKKDGLCEGSR